MKVIDIMVKPVVVVKGTDSLREVARVMLERRIGAVPVVDGDGKLIGIITETDFTAKECGIPFSMVRAPQLFGVWLGRSGVEYIYNAATSIKASEIMQTQVVTVTENDPIEQVLKAMMRHDVNRVPVVRDGVPVGIVARRDLLRLMLAKSALPAA